LPIITHKRTLAALRQYIPQAPTPF
jgi:hypothetical protein